MRIKTALPLLLFLSCVYDPPPKGKELTIHNQTNKQLLVIDSLLGNYFKLYDTATVNGRRFISRQANYVMEYGDYLRFYSNLELGILKKKNFNKITLYFVDQANLGGSPRKILATHAYRSFDISIDTLKKYQLNHLFVVGDTIVFEHDYDYYTNLKH